MEEEKLIRRKKKALNGSNRRVLAEAYNDLASFYYKHNRYGDALDEYKNEAAICKELGLRMEWGTCNRMIGEMYMLQAEFDKALKYEERHLAVAKELQNLVEEQRAMATLGRIYLLQGQSSEGPDAKTSLKAAEKAFMKSLVMCEKLNGKINKHELMDMRARLLLNIGVVQEHLDHFDKAIDCINKAITICSNHDLFEIHHNCYTTQALLYANKTKDYAKALSCLNKALEVASRLEDKVLKTCETLSTKADILCKMSDYQSAKQVLLKAWKLKTPDEDERENIESNLRVVAAICYTEDLLISTNPSDHTTFKKLYEKLGDGACHLKNYAGAVDYYLKMLDHAELAGDCGKTLIPIYVSLYQTYKDMGAYNEALYYYDKEYELIKDVPKEAYTTLFNIAETLFLAKKPYDQVEKACLDARKAAQDWNKRKYEIRILRSLLKYQEEYDETDKLDDTKSELQALGWTDFDTVENSEDDQSPTEGAEDTTHIGDDICLEDLTDLSDTNEEDVTETKRESRRRGKGFTIKKNMKGETQLHVASISGNKLLVERLLAKGHPVNIRDNAGWLPLHEACIHGHTEIVNMLLDHGANINDRGGSNCDGITPLYDAASNGHLEVVQLLLEKGAIPSLKTDFGETPLHVLQKWRTGTILTKDEEILYNNISNKIHNFIDKTNFTDIILNRSKSKTPVKHNKDISPPSTSKSSTKKQLNSPALRRNMIDDHSDDDDDVDSSLKVRQQLAFPSDDSNDSTDDVPTKSKRVASVNEYRNAISALRNRSVSDLPEVDLKKKAKPALLDPEEVDDDWLDDDLGVTKNKKRKLTDPLTTVAKKPSYETIKESVHNINQITEPLVESNTIKQKKSSANTINLSDNSDTEQFQRNENVRPKVSPSESMKNISKEFSRTGDSRDGMRKRWKRQSSLLKAGFQRQREDFDQSSNSGSDSEFTNKHFGKSVSRKNLSSENFGGGFTRKSSGENFGQGDINFGLGSIVQPVNVIQPINIVQSSRNGRPVQTHILPPAAVKVQVEDKVFLISLKLDTINKLTISWLVEEVKSRYYKLTGVRPVFSLMTSDGAILCEDDPLSLVLSSPELKTCITNWKASPAEERYLECCEALGVSPNEEIQQAIGRSVTTHRLSLGSKTLSSSQIRPLFRALTHQTHITAVMISDNNIGDAAIKHLTDCICTMKHLTHLDLSDNNITSDGTKTLLNLFEKSNRPVCQSLEEIYLSSNPISDVGFKNIAKITQHVKLKVLKLNNCKITERSVVDGNKISLDNIESIDISNNDVKMPVVSCLMTALNPNLIVDLELDNIGVSGSVVGSIASFLDSARDLRLRRFALSNCKLVDGQFMRIYRSIGRAKHLQSITLKENNLTFITLKKLLQRQPPVPQINLEGCQDIFKYSPDSDFQVWLPAVDFGRCLPEINVTPVSKSDEERESLKLFSKTWLNCFKGRGVIEHGESGLIKFTAR